MTNDTTSIPTLDVIHVTLEHLGYLGEEFGASRIGSRNLRSRARWSPLQHFD